VGNSIAVACGHAHDRWNACPSYASFGVSTYSSFGMQHGSSVDGRGLDAKVKQF
jgi:hypothetical protein